MTVRSGPGKSAHWEPTELVSTLLSAGARQVVSQWVSSVSYLDDHNDPVMLSMAEESYSGFIQQVHQTDSDLAPAVVLNELLRKGIVEQHVNGHLLLRRSAYAPSQPKQQSGNRLESALNFAQSMRRRRYNDFG